MLKSIIKEFMILILILIAIVLIFAIMLYDYNPLTKTIPKKVEAYTLSEEIQTELQGTLKEEEKIVKTYQVDGMDLDKYRKSDEYNPGKIEPYSLYNEALQSTKPNNTVEPGDLDGNNTSNGVFFNTPGK